MKEIETLVAEYRAGNAEVLDEIVRLSSPIVRNVCRSYFLIGAEGEDLYQEGLLGLLGAVRSYEPGKSSFKNYAYLCVKNSVISAVRKYSGTGVEYPSEALWLSGAEGAAGDPEEMFIEGEVLKELIGKISTEISSADSEILGRYLDGMSYAEIAEATGKSTKSVDNTLQKIKNKLRRQLAEKRG